MLSNDFNEKMLAAEIFEAKKNSNALLKLWKEAKSIEITLDFLEPNGIFAKIFRRFIKNH
ncbi:hypothetical protein IJG72_01640 [bacterium]|nr:hypothetical protein [bacterium]